MDSERIAEILKQAAAAVNQADLPPELHAPAFEKAVDLLGEEGGQPKPAGKKESKGQKASGKKDEQAAPSVDVSLDAIAKKTEATIEHVEDVYGLDSGELKIVIPSSKLSNSDAGASKQLAILLVAGRAATGLDPEWTASEEIREVCKSFSVLNTANFSATIKALSNEFRFTGNRQAMKVKLTRKGWEAAGALIAELAGGAS